MSIVRRIKRGLSTYVGHKLVLNSAKLSSTRRDMALLSLNPPPRGFRAEHREATIKRLEKIAVKG